MTEFQEPSDQGIGISLEDLLRYQILAKQLQFPVQSIATNASPGERKTRILGRGMAFTDLRQYQRGDDIRLIDWRVTARTGKPHTRQYQEDKSQPFYLVADFGTSMYFGSKRQLKSVLAAKLAATLIWQIHDNREPVSLLTVGSDDVAFIHPSTSQRQIYQCLSQLSELSQQDVHHPDQRKHKALESGQWLQAMQMLLKSLQAGSVIVLISDFIDWPDSLLEYCHRLDQRGQLLIYQVFDPIEDRGERQDKAAVSVQFTDGITTEYRQLDSVMPDNHCFLDQPELHRYHRTSVSTHLSLNDQLAAKIQ